MIFESVMPVVGGGRAGRLPSPPRSTGNQFLSAPRSSGSSNFFNEWASPFKGLRDAVEEDDGDGSTSSSPAVSSVFDDPMSPTTMVTFGAKEDAAAAWAIPSPSLARVDSLGLIGLEDIRLRDGSLSPLPPGLILTMDLIDPLGIVGMDQNTQAPWTSSGEDTTMSDIAFYSSLPDPMESNSLPNDVFSHSLPTGSCVGRSNTVPSRKSFPMTPGDVTGRKRTRDQRSSPQRRPSSCDCILPDRPTPGQKAKGLLLTDLPTEILVEIFRYAILWSPPRPPQYKHRLVPHRPYSRRATTGDVHVRPRLVQHAGPSSASASILTEPKPNENPREKKLFGVNTLLRIEHTCKHFREILKRGDQFTDEIFWMVAARSCWKWLPEKLSDVQGHDEASQTSWRNLVEVFGRSENSQFGTGEKGKGGVDCFGAKRVCPPASTWEMEKTRRKEIGRNGRRPRRLLIACAQPGPDMFAVTPDEGSRSWTISLSARYGEEYMVRLDEYGRFGKAGKVPEGLKRSTNVGFFAPGIFKHTTNRLLLVKARVLQGLQSTQLQARSPGMTQAAVTWDLSTIPEYVADEKAHVARCTSHEGVLLCSFFTHRNPSDLDEYLDPPEDPRLFCVEAPMYNFDSAMSEDTNGMSSKMRGKLPEKAAPAGEGMNFRWRRDFEYRDQTAAGRARALHPVVCNIQINARHAVALIRWNETTSQSMQQLFDREFHVLDAMTGETVKLLEFPNLFWDFRHHDMHREYNLMRVDKLKNLYNPRPSSAMGPSGNRATRVHQDAFFLTSENIISGSHDYCNWVWPLERPTPPWGSYTAEHNDGGRIPEPFDVLDDYYWNVPSSTSNPGTSKTLWEPTNERAGWWVRTPNQVLCFWHGAALSHDQQSFAVCRPGKMFVWNLAAADSNREVVGFTCLTPAANTTTTTDHCQRQRWLGRPKKEVEKAVLESWNLCEDVVPEQGLWLLYEGEGDGDGDGGGRGGNDAVFIGRDEILQACGLAADGVQWGFQQEDFGWDDEKMVLVGEDEREGKMGKKRRISSDSDNKVSFISRRGRR